MSNSSRSLSHLLRSCLSTIVDYHFLTENYFHTMCTTIRSYSVGVGFD